MNFKRLTATLLAGAACAGIASADASADSIAYIKAGDVWLSTSDGSRQFQVTSTGGYDHVSQADDGTLLGTNAGHLRRLDRLGDVLSDIPTPVSTMGTSAFTFYGPWDADISPNGKTAAYGWASKSWSTTGGVLHVNQDSGTGFTHPDALTGFTDDGFKHSSGWDGPEFIDDQTVIEGDGPGAFDDPIAVETVGSGDPHGWFSDPDNMHPLEPTVSRNKRVIAAVVGPDRQGITVYRDWDGQLLGTVSACFTYSSDGSDGAPAMESPTLNADGSQLAYSDGHALLIAHLGSMVSDCPSGENARSIVAGATSPDWGPADVPTSRPAAPAPAPAPAPTPAPASVVTKPGTAHGGAAGQQSGGGSSADGALRLKVAHRSLRSALRGGLPVTLDAKAGSLTMVAKAGKTVIARKTLHIAKSGTVTVDLVFSRAQAKRYRNARSLKLSLSATQGGRTASTAVTLKR